MAPASHCGQKGLCKIPFGPCELSIVCLLHHNASNQFQAEAYFNLCPHHVALHLVCPHLGSGCPDIKFQW